MADFYGDVEGLKTYFTARGKDIPALWDNDDIEAGLLVASEWIDGVYGSSFIGWKTGGFPQVREWPRANAIVNYISGSYTFPDNVIPDQVENATYEAAFRQLTTPGVLIKDYTPGKYKRVSVDGAVSVEYAGVTFASDIQSVFPIIDIILAQLLNAASSVSSYIGSSSRV